MLVTLKKSYIGQLYWLDVLVRTAGVIGCSGIVNQLEKNEFTGKHLPKRHSLKYNWITSIGFEVFQTSFLLHPNNLWHRLPRIPIVSCNTGAHSCRQVPLCRVYLKSSSSLELLFWSRFYIGLNQNASKMFISTVLFRNEFQTKEYRCLFALICNLLFVDLLGPETHESKNTCCGFVFIPSSFSLMNTNDIFCIRKNTSCFQSKTRISQVGLLLRQV